MSKILIQFIDRQHRFCVSYMIRKNLISFLYVNTQRIRSINNRVTKHWKFDVVLKNCSKAAKQPPAGIRISYSARALNA